MINFINITNNAGTTIPFKFEDFNNNEVNFALYGAITPRYGNETCAT